MLKDSKKVHIGEYSETNKYDSLIIKLNGKWYEVANDSLHYAVFGEYENKLYYADDEAFKYIDLSTKEFNSTTWIKYEEKCYDDENRFVDYAYADFGSLKDGTIYFVKDSYGWDKERDSYLYTLKTTATSYSDIQKEFNQAGIIDFVIKDNMIYYYHWEDEIPATQTLKSYDIASKKTTTLYKKVSGISIANQDNIIFCISPDVAEKWYLYNLNTKKEELIATLNNNEEEMKLSGMFQMYNESVYYLESNTIKKYKDGQTTTVYKLGDEDLRYGGQGGGIEVVNDDLFDYSSLARDGYGYVYKGKKAKKAEVEEYLEKYNIKRKNGETATIYKSETEVY